MVQEFDEINNNNHNNNNNNSLFNEDGSTSIEHASNNTNVIIEEKDNTSNNDICTGLTNDHSTISSNEQVVSSLLSSLPTMETAEQMTININGTKYRRDKKLQERWTITTKNENHNQSSPNKAFLGIEFPPIEVLRRKFSSLPAPTILNPLPIKRKDSSMIKSKGHLNNTEVNNPSEDNINKANILNPSISSEIQEFETITTITAPVEDSTKSDQVDDKQFNDIASLINNHETKHYDNNDDMHQSSIDQSELSNNLITIGMKEDLNSSTIEHVKESSVNMNADFNNENHLEIVTDLYASDSTFSSSSSSSSSSMTNTNEFLLKDIVEQEEEEKEKKEEEKAYYHDDNVDVKEKNNTNVERNYHASGMLLINDEPTQTLLFEQEKKEQHSTSLLTAEDCNQQRPVNDCSIEILSNDLDKMINVNVEDNDQRYKTVEIEEIPDEEEEQEVLLAQTNHQIQPTDYIVTDDEPRKPRQTNTITTPVINENPVEFDPVLSCYEKVLSKVAETIGDSTNVSSSSESSLSTSTDRNRRPEDDPIALRALQRFEQRMSAAVAAKTTNEETNFTSTRGKSSWSGTSTTPRKSLENLFKNNQQLPPTSTSTNEQISTTPKTSPRQRDTFIRPRKSMLDDVGLNFGMAMNVFNVTTNNSTNDNHDKSEEQQQPMDITGYANERVTTAKTMEAAESKDHQEQQQQQQQQEHESEPVVPLNASTAHESSTVNEIDESNPLAATSTFENLSPNTSINEAVSELTTEQQSLTPYHLQLASRPRLNTHERFHEYRQNYDLNSSLSQQQQQPSSSSSYQNNYNVKPEDLQDPIIRRALERFDEKSRSLAQSKPTNYDDIQDPITRRALMRLETSLKRTAPSNPPPISNEPNETWYTNSYTLGSLQTNNDNRLGRYLHPSLPPTSNSKPPHASVHQRFCSTSTASSDMPEVFTGNMSPNNEQDIPTIRVPTQPVYVTSNQQQQQPISFRQRSRSEDMLSSREMSLSQVANIDENDTSQIQRNHSSNQLASQETSVSTEVNLNDPNMQLPQTIIKTIDPNFVRTQEAAVNYATPTQTYSAYSCEYTRPHRTQSVESTRPEFSPRNFQQQQQQLLPPSDNSIQYPNSSSSAFTPVHPSTNNYYPSPQSLTMPLYTSMYTSNNPHQTPYSDDPIVRRALERFNSQMQNSMMNTSQHQPHTNLLPRQFSSEYLRQGSHDPSFYPPESLPYDTSYVNYNRGIPPATGVNTGYQSIIGRRRHIRHDDVYHDSTNIGNGYTTPLFANSQNPYPSVSPYVNYSDEPPVIPPRLHRDLYHEQQQQQEYQSDNINSNNNNNNNNNGYLHYGYPPTINGFRSTNHHLMPSDSFHQYQEEEYLRHRAQSTSSTTSSDSVNQIRLIQQRLPPTSPRTNMQQNKKNSPDNSQIPSGRTTPSNGSQTGDSVFHRLSHTSTKSSLSKSSSNLCANLSNKNLHQHEQQPIKSHNLKTHEIDLDESITTENHPTSITSPTNNLSKCQRSRSVDGRARLKNAQNRVQNIHRPTNDYDDHHHNPSIPSSRFTSVQSRYNAQPPRVPSTPRYTHSERPSITKRLPNGNHSTHTKTVTGVRTRAANANLVDAENDENLATNDNYQPKILENKTRPSIPGHRYANNSNNNIQTSASTSSVSAAISRAKVPVSSSANLYRRDLNASGTDLNRSSKRSDDPRLLSPPTQRRQVPVSVFSPAKNENKRPAPVPSSSITPTNESVPVYTGESQQESQQLPRLSRSPTGDSSYITMHNENEMNKKVSTTNTMLKSSTENILSELSFPNDKHDTSKKMNVFERLFRGHKKKV